MKKLVWFIFGLWIALWSFALGQPYIHVLAIVWLVLLIIETNKITE